MQIISCRFHYTDSIPQILSYNLSYALLSNLSCNLLCALLCDLLYILLYDLLCALLCALLYGFLFCRFYHWHYLLIYILKYYCRSIVMRSLNLITYKNMYLSLCKLIRIRDSKRRKSSYQNGYCLAIYIHEQITCIRLDLPCSCL